MHNCHENKTDLGISTEILYRKVSRENWCYENNYLYFFELRDVVRNPWKSQEGPRWEQFAVDYSAISGSAVQFMSGDMHRYSLVELYIFAIFFSPTQPILITHVCVCVQKRLQKKHHVLRPSRARRDLNLQPVKVVRTAYKVVINGTYSSGAQQQVHKYIRVCPHQFWSFLPPPAGAGQSSEKVTRATHGDFNASGEILGNRLHSAAVPVTYSDHHRFPQKQFSNGKNKLEHTWKKILVWYLKRLFGQTITILTAWWVLITGSIFMN